jgi:hypothetical protein
MDDIPEVDASLIDNDDIFQPKWWEMVATFCNVASSPNHAGYGTNGGAAATSAGITTPSPAIPACGEGIVTANELCN